MLTASCASAQAHIKVFEITTPSEMLGAMAFELSTPGLRRDPETGEYTCTALEDLDDPAVPDE